jgi:hypothetical protein
MATAAETCRYYYLCILRSIMETLLSLMDHRLKKIPDVIR